MSKLADEVLHTLSYFDHFAYPPSTDELRKFLRVRSSVQQLKGLLRLLDDKEIIVLSTKRIALRSKVLKDYWVKKDYSIQLLRSFERILPWYSWIPTIQLLGISGSLSMYDVDHEGDIDIFLIVQAQTIWLTRFYVLVITRFLTLWRVFPACKLCWNIIAEETSLSLPIQKRNEYTAHEILQMKPLIVKGNMYDMFLCANKWVMEIFPNVHLKCTEEKENYRLSKKSKALKYLDIILQFFQMKWLDTKGFRVTDYEGQFWFIQDDAEKSIPVKLKKV